MVDIRKFSMELEGFLNRLNGETCRTFIAGDGTGSMVNIYFGQMLRRNKPIKNITLTAYQREFEGEFGVFVMEANWSIKKGGKVICNNDNNLSDEVAITGLSILVDKKVISTRFFESTLNFQIVFENDIELDVNCISDNDEYFSNYVFFDQDLAISVDGKSNVDVESVHKRSIT